MFGNKKYKTLVEVKAKVVACGVCLCHRLSTMLPLLQLEYRHPKVDGGLDGDTRDIQIILEKSVLGQFRVGQKVKILVVAEEE